MGQAQQARLEGYAAEQLRKDAWHVNRAYQVGYLEGAIKGAIIQLSHQIDPDAIARDLSAALEAAAKGPNHD